MTSESKNNDVKPKLYEFYTAKELWTDEYISKQMLAYHLNAGVDLASRKPEFMDKSVDWIVSHFNVGDNTSIADFGCGPGLYTNRLAKKGAQVTAIDFSKNSIEYAIKIAEQENLSINYVNENYLEYETGERFDVILMIMCDFCVLSPTQREMMLKKFHTLLKPGGHVLLDVNSVKAYEDKEERFISEPNLMNGFWAEGEYKGYLEVFKYDDEKVILDKYTIVESSRTRTIYNWFKHFTPEELEGEFNNSAFTVENFYADVVGTPFDPDTTEFAVVAKYDKKGTCHFGTLLRNQ